MNHITQEQAAKFADQAEIDAERILQDTGEYHPDHWQVEAQLLCNAAIEHYIAQQAAKEPIAYFDFQEHGFYWAPNVKVGDVPVIRKIAPMPLYSDLYKKDQKIDTSQERVYETAKSEQMPLTDEQCDIVLQRLDRWARDYDGHEYGLPLMLLPLRARDVLREALGEKA